MESESPSMLRCELFFGECVAVGGRLWAGNVWRVTPPNPQTLQKYPTPCEALAPKHAPVWMFRAGGWAVMGCVGYVFTPGVVATRNIIYILIKVKAISTVRRCGHQTGAFIVDCVVLGM